MKTAQNNFENWAIERYTDIKLIEEEPRSNVYCKYSALNKEGKPVMLYQTTIDNKITVHVSDDIKEFLFEDDTLQFAVLELEEKVDRLTEVINKLIDEVK